MGMGDVKLAGLLGLLLGSAVAPAILIALIGGVVVGLVMLARRAPGDRRRAGVPFGPFLASARCPRCSADTRSWQRTCTTSLKS